MDDFDVAEFEKPEFIAGLAEEVKPAVLDLIESSMIDLADVINDWVGDNSDNGDDDDAEDTGERMGAPHQLQLQNLSKEQVRYLVQLIVESPDAQSLLRRKVSEAMNALIVY